MKISIVLVLDLNKEYFDLFNNRDDISDVLKYYSFTAKKNEIIFINKSLVKSNENIILVGTNGCDSVDDWVSSGALTGKKNKI